MNMHSAQISVLIIIGICTWIFISRIFNIGNAQECLILENAHEYSLLENAHESIYWKNFHWKMLINNHYWKSCPLIKKNLLKMIDW